MFRARSWIQHAGVALFLLASLCTGTFALPHTGGFDDFACIPGAINHDESAHSIGAARPSTHASAEHCFLCHSLRSFFSAFEKFEQRNASPRAERLHAATVAFAGHLAWSLLPGRAPPV